MFAFCNETFLLTRINANTLYKCDGAGMPPCRARAPRTVYVCMEGIKEENLMVIETETSCKNREIYEFELLN